MGLFLTSDLHFNHDREFVYRPRGFDNIEEMNEAIISNWNNRITFIDDVYVLGDLCLGGPNSNEKNKELIERLNGHIYIIRGNHDTISRLEMYCDCKNIIEIYPAAYLKHLGYNFYLTHYPCFTGNLEKESLKQCVCNLYGHTHQKNNFYLDMPFMYHVGVDSHNCTPVEITDIIHEMEEKMNECKSML